MVEASIEGFASGLVQDAETHTVGGTTHVVVTQPSAAKRSPKRTKGGIHDGSNNRAHEWMAGRRDVALDRDWCPGDRPAGRHDQQVFKKVIVE